MVVVVGVEVVPPPPSLPSEDEDTERLVPVVEVTL